MKRILLTALFLCFLSVPVFAQSTLALQERCAEGARKFFENQNSQYVIDYISLYSKKWDKCFIRIGYYFGVEEEKVENGTISLRLPAWGIKVYDVFGGSMIADYDRGRGETIFCWVGDRKCNSPDEFEALIKPYMEE